MITAIYCVSHKVVHSGASDRYPVYSLQRGSNRIPREHGGQGLKHSTQQDWTSQNETDGDRMSPMEEPHHLPQQRMTPSTWDA